MLGTQAPKYFQDWFSKRGRRNTVALLHLLSWHFYIRNFQCLPLCQLGARKLQWCSPNQRTESSRGFSESLYGKVRIWVGRTSRFALVQAGRRSHMSRCHWIWWRLEFNLFKSPMFRSTWDECSWLAAHRCQLVFHHFSRIFMALKSVWCLKCNGMDCFSRCPHPCM